VGKRKGRLGRERPPLDIEFDYFDEVIRVHPYATDAVEAEFMEAATGVNLADLVGLDLTQFTALDRGEQAHILQKMSEAQQNAYRALKKALRELIHPDDFERYWDVGNKHGQQIRDRSADIKAITEWVLDEITDFRTGQPSGSAGGQPTTQPQSAADSSSPEGAGPGGTGAAEALTGTVVLPGSDLERALALERGRPDIQEFYLMQAEEAEQAAREAREAQDRDRRKLADAGYASAG
jgi:hypothetical protein